MPSQDTAWLARALLALLDWDLVTGGLGAEGVSWFYILSSSWKGHRRGDAEMEGRGHIRVPSVPGRKRLCSWDGHGKEVCRLGPPEIDLRQRLSPVYLT